MRHALWTRITAKSAGVWFPEIIMVPSMFWGLGKARNMKRIIIIILAFYFIDPFPMFLVKDHFSCKYQSACYYFVSYKSKKKKSSKVVNSSMPESSYS